MRDLKAASFTASWNCSAETRALQLAVTSSPRRDHLERRAVQGRVAGERALDGLLRLGEGGRVADHEVEAPPLRLVEAQDLEGVLGGEGVVGRVEAVPAEVLPGGRDGIPVDVDGHHVPGASQRRGHGEAARVAEEVERVPAPRRHLPHQPPVLALVEEEAGLLPLPHVDEELHPVLVNLDLLGGSAPQSTRPSGRASSDSSSRGTSSRPKTPASPSTSWRNASTMRARCGVRPAE